MDAEVSAYDDPGGKSGWKGVSEVSGLSWNWSWIFRRVGSAEEMGCNRGRVVVDDDLSVAEVLVEGIEVVCNLVVPPAVDVLLKPLGLARIRLAINPGMSFLSGGSGVLKDESGKFVSIGIAAAGAENRPFRSWFSNCAEVLNPVSAVSKFSSKVLREGVQESLVAA